MAIRRRRKVTWLPTIGTNAGEGLGDTNGRNFTVNAPLDGSLSTIVLPVTFDEPRDIDTYGTDIITMADAIGSEYMLNRIVGKLFAARAIAPPGDPDTDCPVLFGAGFFVARAADGNQNIPVGATTNQDLSQLYSPLEVDTVREPWIWRRTWVLGAAGALRQDAAANALTAAAPASTMMYGSVADGPHIDAKTKRRVGQDERLFFAASVINFPVGTPNANIVFVVGYLDIRLLGSLLRARNRGVF